MSPNEMSVEQCRDWVAKSQGWRAPIAVEVGWCRTENGKHEETHAHPYPATIDAAAKAMPEGWSLCVEQRRKWSCLASRDDDPRARTMEGAPCVVALGPDELTARWRLVVACLQAKGAV